MFWEKVRIQANGHWLWLGSIDPKGYGKFHSGKVNKRAHRYSLELFLGRDLLPDHDAHHIETCKVHNCICPWHLAEVPHNNHPGAAPEKHRKKTHCLFGHEYSVENTGYHNYNNSRYC